MAELQDDPFKKFGGKTINKPTQEEKDPFADFGGKTIKKKALTEGLNTQSSVAIQELQPSSPTSSTTYGTNYPVGSLPEAGQNNQFGFPSTTVPFAGADPTIPATQLEEVQVTASKLPQYSLSPERLAQIDAAYGGDRNELNTARKSASGDSGEINTYKPDEAPIANRAKYLYNKLLQGVGSVASGLGDISVQIATNLPKGSSMYAPNINQEETPEEKLARQNLLTDYRSNVAPSVRSFLKDTIGSKKGEEREGQYNQETFTGALGGLAQSVPAMAATAASGGIGAGAMFLQSYDNALESIDQSEAGRNLDDVTKTIFATTVGTVTSALEKYGFDKIFKGETGVISNLIAQRALKNAGKETGEKITGDVLSKFLDKELVSLSNRFVKGGAKALDGALVEYGTEALQEGAQAGAEILVNKTTGKPVFDISETSKWDGFLARMNKAGIAGAIGGGLLGGVAGLANLSKGDVVKQEQSITDIDSALANESLSDASREVLVQRKVDLQNRLQETASKIDEAYDKLDPKQKDEVNGIVEEKIKLKEAINDPELSEEIKTSLQEQSDALDKQLSEIKPVEGAKEVNTIETTTQAKEAVTEPKTASNEEATKVTEQQVPKTEETVAKTREESVNEDVQPQIGDTVEYNLNGEVFKGKLKAITPNDEYVVTKPDGTDYTTGTLQNFKPIGEVVAPEPQTNKNIVEEAYKSNKEIESVGDAKQYDNYVKSIFPESQTKEPMYHGSPNEFENFDLGKLGENSKNTGYFGEGLYFTPKKSMADAYGDKTYRVVLDTKNPFKKTAKNFEDLYERLKGLGLDKKYFDGRALALITQAYPQYSKQITQAIKDMGYDSVVDWNETIVFDPKQVHILGTKNDASKFKEFVGGDKNTVDKPKYTIKGETVTPKGRTVSSNDLNKIGKAFSDRFGIGYEVISKEKANQILNLRSKKDIFFQILDDVDIFKNKNIEDSKAFVEKVFSTVESAADAKSAYKRLAGKFHPDRDGGSNEIMQYLNNAKDKYDKGGYKKSGSIYKDPIFKTYADHVNDLRNWANKKTKDFRDDLSPEDLKRFEEERMAFEKKKQSLKENRKSAIDRINNQLKSDLEEIRDYVKSRKETIRKRTDISEYKKGDLLADVDLKRSELEETYRNKAEEQRDAINNKLDDDLDKLGSDFDNKWSFQKKGDRIGGFYDKVNKKAYLVEGVADETTAIHEMFSHPFISAIEAEHPELFKNILNEAKNDSQIKEYVDANYGELTGLDRNHEYIAAAIDLESRNQLKNKSLIDYIDQFWKIIKDNISTIFGGKKVTGFDKNTKIKDIVDFILNSDESIDLKGKENVNTLNEPVVGGETKANAAVKPSFDELATRSLEGDVVKNTLSNVERETNTKLDKTISEYNAADFKSAFVQGEQTVQAAKEEFGKDYVSKFTDYVKESKMPFENKAVMLVSLENDLRKQYLENPTPQLKKQVDLATKNSIEFLRSSARATGVGIFRQAARANYETEAAAEAIFSPKERQERTKVEEAVQSTSEDVQREYEARQETQTDSVVQEAIDKGVQARIDDIYEALPSSRKQAADKAISALERIQKKLRSRTYDASIGIPVAIIDAGITTIKQAIKAGVKVADAIELGINKIKERYGKEWKNEDKFRKDMLEGFSDENIDVQDGTRTAKTSDKLKQELIDAGYGKEITVTTKNGKEKRNIIDWKKLTGIEGSFDRMKENLEESLKKKGYSESEINEFQKQLEDEYNDIHADIIQKSLNELNRRNTPREATAKTLARRLAELYNLGLYDKDVDTYSNILNNALGISPKSQAAFNEIRDFNRSLAQLLDSRGVNGERLTDLEIITAENEIKAHIQKVIQKVQFAEGNMFFKFSDVMKNIFSAMQRMMLAKISQLIENPFSGALNDTQVKLQDAFSKGKWDTKELRENRAMLGRAIYADASLKGGDEYGGVGNPFTTKNSIESFVNGLSKNAMYQAFVGMLSGRQYLDATDSYYKIKRTEKEFTNNLLRILTDKTNPNGAMDQNDALRFVSEALTGQSFNQAKETARGIITSINDKAGKEIIRPAETNVTRIANDLVKDNLVLGGKMTMTEVESAFKAAYKTAGKSIGHESNNLLTDVVNATNQTIQRKLDEALKKKDWSTAAVLNLTSILSKNIVNPFVGGGTNWTVIGLQKMGLPTEWIRSDVGFSKKPIDLSTKEGLKELKDNLSANATRQRQFGRIMTGTLTALAAVMAVRYSGDEEEYKKWLKDHPDTRKLINKIQPVPLTLYLARDNKNSEFIKAIASTLGSRYNAQTDGDKLFKAVNDFWDGYDKGNDKKTKKAWGTVGQLMGRRINVPYVSSISNYGDMGNKLYKEFVGKPVKDPYKSPKGFVDGYFKGGLMDYLNITPQDIKEDKK